MIARFLRVVSALLLGTIMASAAEAERCTLGVTGTSRVAIGTGGRGMIVHWPSGYDGGRVPLVLLLHGSGGSGAAVLAESRLGETADRHGFIVAAPDGGIAHARGFVWNIPGVPTIAGTLPAPDAPDDVAFVGAALDRLIAAGCVDPARSYATGISGGGRMASWLGCVAAARFAAIAPVVGLRAGRPLASDPARPDPATCRPARPIAVIAFAGDADTTNPIAGGGAGYWRYSMHAAEARWAALDRCGATATAGWVASAVYEERYAGCAAGTEVVTRISVGGGHHWLADNEAMWAFFTRFRRAP